LFKALANLFLEVFELRQEGVEYVDKDNQPFDEDWTIPAIASIIRSGRTTFHSYSKKQKEELTKDNIKQFFLTNKIYKKFVTEDSHNHTLKLKRYRQKNIINFFSNCLLKQVIKEFHLLEIRLQHQ
jgi:hypothetical protein